MFGAGVTEIMSTVVKAPTSAILKVGDLIDGTIPHFIEARSKILPRLGKWEAEIEAINLFNLVIRYLEGIIELARTDLVLLPAANVLARAVFEIAIKAAWMMQPDDPFEREVRWLVHLSEDAIMNEQIVARVEKFGGDPCSFREHGGALRGFYRGVVAKLPEGYPVPQKCPKVDVMLESLGHKRVYSVYKLLAAYVHGSHGSTWLYRKHLGIHKEVGEFITASSWHLPLWASWTSFAILGSDVLERLGAEDRGFVSSEEATAIDQALKSLGG
jgi:hypothetical protein